MSEIKLELVACKANTPHTVLSFQSQFLIFLMTLFVGLVQMCLSTQYLVFHIYLILVEIHTEYDYTRWGIDDLHQN